MGELFERKVILDVAKENGVPKRIEGLRIAFSVLKTSTSDPNRADIQIYNLSDQSRSLFEAKNAAIILSFGYMGLMPDGIAGTGFASTKNVEVVFRGNVTKVAHKIKSPDIITEIEVGDGDNRFRNARISKGYPPNASLSLVVDDLVVALGLPKGAILNVPDRKYANGLSLSGLARDKLNMICAANDLEWSIQDETVQIIQKNTFTTETPIFLDPKSGLVGSPAKTKDGIEFESLIQPTLRPNKRVLLNSRFIKGYFKLRRVKHEGDSHDGTFLSKCEAIA